MRSCHGGFKARIFQISGVGVTGVTGCFEQRLAVAVDLVVGLRLAAVATSLGVHRRGPGPRGKRQRRKPSGDTPLDPAPGGALVPCGRGGQSAGALHPDLSKGLAWRYPETEGKAHSYAADTHAAGFAAHFPATSVASEGLQGASMAPALV